VPLDDRDRAEAVVPDLEQPVGMIKRGRDPNERHRSELIHAAKGYKDGN